MKKIYDSTSRRRFLALTGVSAAGLSGCLSQNEPDNGTDEDHPNTYTDHPHEENPYDLSDRPEPGGTPMAELPELKGELNLYLGRGEGGLYQGLIDRIESRYDDFEITVKQNRSASLANTIVEEEKAGKSPADVFWSIDAGSLGTVADDEYTRKLPDRILDKVRKEFRSPKGQWVGTAGRARAVPFNTRMLSKNEIPNSVKEFPKKSEFQDKIGWAPSYGAFQSFVTAMRLMWGDGETKKWLKGIQDLGVKSYPDEFVLSNAVADGEIELGFANHYYPVRVKQDRKNAPLQQKFMSGGPGALVNVAGAEVISSSDQPENAANFIGHLLSAEAQEYFATTTFAYPMISGVKPVGNLPPVNELNPPDINLSKLSNIRPTLDLMRKAGIEV
ncbi:MAG: extracellular solute-binding protein [Halobacteria archaeon]